METKNYEKYLESIQLRIEQLEEGITEMKTGLEKARTIRQNRMEHEGKAENSKKETKGSGRQERRNGRMQKTAKVMSNI